LFSASGGLLRRAASTNAADRGADVVVGSYNVAGRATVRALPRVYIMERARGRGPFRCLTPAVPIRVACRHQPLPSAAPATTLTTIRFCRHPRVLVTLVVLDIYPPGACWHAIRASLRLRPSPGRLFRASVSSYRFRRKLCWRRIPYGGHHRGRRCCSSAACGFLSSILDRRSLPLWFILPSSHVAATFFKPLFYTCWHFPARPRHCLPSATSRYWLLLPRRLRRWRPLAACPAASHRLFTQ